MRRKWVSQWWRTTGIGCGRRFSARGGATTRGAAASRRDVAGAAVVTRRALASRPRVASTIAVTMRQRRPDRISHRSSSATIAVMAENTSENAFTWSMIEGMTPNTVAADHHQEPEGGGGDPGSGIRLHVVGRGGWCSRFRRQHVLAHGPPSTRWLRPRSWSGAGPAFGCTCHGGARWTIGPSGWPQSVVVLSRSGDRVRCTPSRHAMPGVDGSGCVSPAGCPAGPVGAAPGARPWRGEPGRSPDARG